MSLRLLLVASFAIPACGDPGQTLDPNELITTVTLTFTPAAGGNTVVAEFDDPDGDGGDPPMIDSIALPPGNYTLAVGFENRLEDPPEDITIEIADEAERHQIFFTGSAVNGPASDQPGAPLAHAYADTDAGGLPIGLSSDIIAGAGSGELTLTLRHLPPVNGVAVKTGDLAAQVRSGGIDAIGGESDAHVTFMVNVP